MEKVKINKFVHLQKNVLQNIFSFLNIKQALHICFLNKNLNIFSKIFKIRHYKIMVFLYSLFFKNHSSLYIFQYFFTQNNYTDIRDKFKILPEKDVLKGISLFLISLHHENKYNNIFYVKFTEMNCVEFINKFVQIHDISSMKVVIDLNVKFSSVFYQYLSQNSILIDEMNILPTSKCLDKIFDYKLYKYSIKTLRILYSYRHEKILETLKNYFFNNKNSLKELEIFEYKESMKESDNKDILIALIEFNSDTLVSLKLDISFSNIEKFNKTLSRCRFLKTFHLNFKTNIANDLLTFKHLEPFMTSLSFCKNIEELILNPELILDENIYSILKSMKVINKTYLNLDVINFNKEVCQRIINANLEIIIISFTNSNNFYFDEESFNLFYNFFLITLLNSELKEIDISFEFDLKIFNININKYICILFKKFYLSTTNLKNKLKILKIKIKGKFENSNEFSLLLVNFVNIYKLETLEIVCTHETDELIMLKEKDKIPIFIFKADTVDANILKTGVKLSEGTNALKVYYKGKLQTFTDFFKNYCYHNTLRCLKGIRFQNDCVEVEYAYKLREICLKITNVDMLEFKNLVFKSDIFDIIGEKLVNIKHLKLLSLVDIAYLEEKSVFKMLSFLNTNKLSKIVINNVNIGDSFWEYLADNKSKFSRLLTIDIRTNKKITKAFDFVYKFLLDNYFCFEIILKESMIYDPNKLKKIINTYRFIKFVLV